MPDRLPSPPGRKRSISLIGLMAAGKSSVGRGLAERLDMRFVDTDEAIEAETGQTVRALWEEGGEAAYRPRERDAVASALAGREPVVLAVPGGVAVDDGMAAIVAGSDAVVVYLRARPETLAGRVGAPVDGDDHRPLLGDDPVATLTALHHERDSRYAALADVVVDVDGRSVAELVAQILALGPHGTTP